jgi:hypothetical protein
MDEKHYYSEFIFIILTDSYMELRPGKLLNVSYTNSKCSLTTVSGASSTSDGLRRFPTKSSGKRPTSPQLRKN